MTGLYKEVAVDWRTNEFLERFTIAKGILGAKTIQDLVSVKFRERCVNNGDYQELINFLEHDTNLNVKKIQVKGTAWLISDKNNDQLILIEHETGPEILLNIAYNVAGSVVAYYLLPYISQGLMYARDMFRRKYHHNDNMGDKTELRKFNLKNKLVEEQINSFEKYLTNIYNNQFGKMTKRIVKLENENKVLKSRLNKKKK